MWLDWRAVGSKDLPGPKPIEITIVGAKCRRHGILDRNSREPQNISIERELFLSGLGDIARATVALCILQLQGQSAHHAEDVGTL